MEPKSFVETFEMIRKRKGLSKNAVARGAGMEVSNRKLLNLKMPHPPLTTLLALATGLGLTLEDEDCLALLRSAGYELDDLSAFNQSIREGWPRSEGLRITINTMRMHASLARHLASDVVHEAPMTDIYNTSLEVDLYLKSLIPTATLLQEQFEHYDKIAHPYKGQLKERNSRSIKKE